MHASPISKFFSMIQYSYSFKFVFIFFVPHKIGLKVLSGTFFRIWFSLLEAEIWRFLWCHLVGCSLYWVDLSIVKPVPGKDIYEILGFELFFVKAIRCEHFIRKKAEVSLRLFNILREMGFSFFYAKDLEFITLIGF